MDGTFAFALIHDSTKPLQFHAFHLQFIGKLSDFWLKQSKKDIGYRLDGDFQGILQTCCSCSTGHCAPSGSARLKYLRHADVHLDRCKLAVQCNVIPSSLRKRRVQALEPELQEVTSGFPPRIHAHLIGNRVCLLVHLTKVTKICQIYQLYAVKKWAQLGHCSVIHRKQACQARDKGSSSTPYQ